MFGLEGRMRWLLALPVAVFGGLLWVSGVLAEDDPFHKPVRRTALLGSFDADRQLRFELHDWKTDDIVTGRYVAFTIPMGHVWPHWTWADGPTGSVTPVQTYVKDAEGGPSFEPRATSQETFGGANKVVGSPPGFSARISAFNTPNTQRLNKVMIHAEQFGTPFPGYEAREVNVFRPGDLHYLNIQYCGFEAFEKVELRTWHAQEEVDLTSPPPTEIGYPFDRARYFGCRAETV